MTIEQRLENIERELGRAKRRNRWLLAANLLLIEGLIVPLVFETTAFRARAQGAGTAKVIRAKNFVLEDENGEVRAGLAMVEDGPGLSLFDEKDVVRFAAGKALVTSPDGKTIEYPESSLILFGPDGKVVWRAIK